MIQFLKRNPFWAIAAIATLFAVIYWGVMATDRYVSRAHIVLQTPEIVPTGLNVSSLLSGTSGSGDLLLLKDHMESVAMLNTLQQKLDLRAHYSRSEEHTSELQSRENLVCRLLLEKKKDTTGAARP